MPTIPDWARAHGVPDIQGYVRQSPGDFEVTEVLGFDLTGTGEHDYLWLEKENANTSWVAGKLARFAGIRESDVGFAGMKDRKALTRQWFSVRRPSSSGTDWGAFELPGVRIVRRARHARKLRRGALRCNEFRIALRQVDAPRGDVTARLERIREKGVPNYFGDQRFGRAGNNLNLAAGLFAGKRVTKSKRGIALSAARSFLFNHILEQRVLDGSWNRLVPGECACLDGVGSYFAVGDIDDELVERCDRMDVHPGGALWGRGKPPVSGAVLALERRAVAPFAAFREGLESRMELSRRALRLRVSDLEWVFDGSTLWLEFNLRSGGYATAVLREVAKCQFDSD